MLKHFRSLSAPTYRWIICSFCGYDKVNSDMSGEIDGMGHDPEEGSSQTQQRQTETNVPLENQENSSSSTDASFPRKSHKKTKRTSRFSLFKSFKHFSLDSAATPVEAKPRKQFWSFRKFFRKTRTVRDAKREVHQRGCICTGFKRRQDPPTCSSFACSSATSPKIVSENGAGSPVHSRSDMAFGARAKGPGDILFNGGNDECYQDQAVAQRARDIENGVDLTADDGDVVAAPQIGLRLCAPEPNPSYHLYHSNRRVHDEEYALVDTTALTRTVHTQVDYIHCLVPQLTDIARCSFYWGVMDRYEAERLLENRREGTFLLRDSAQEEFLFSVSFRRYGRSLHARIEQWNHRFSFDSHDPGVYSAETVCGLIEHYKDPGCCMFFEPMLTLPLARTYPFSLQHLCRAAICTCATYDGLDQLPLPSALKEYLRYYHYKQKYRVRRF